MTFEFPLKSQLIVPPFSRTSAGAFYIARPIVQAWIANPLRPDDEVELDLLLDTGADACFLPEFLAVRLHIDLRQSFAAFSASATGLLRARFCRINFRIANKVDEYRWSAMAGFVPRNYRLFQTGPIGGILGQLGGLDQFDTRIDHCSPPPRVVLTPCAGGPA